MPNLEIITIGTELLLGEIIDTNSTYIARSLRDHGIDIYRITTIGDNPVRITSAIKEALTRADIIITTGGLGPTVDDPTRKSVADATNRTLVFSEQLWQQVIKQFKKYHRKPTENNRRQAHLPKGAIPIHNPVGTAPSFIVETRSGCVISLPGVPEEMKYILHQSIIPYLKEKYQLKSQIIKATVLHAASIGESAVDELIDDLERSENPTVGLLAHPGQVDIRVTAKARSEKEANEISQPVIEKLLSRLGDHIYGKNNETLASVIGNLVDQQNVQITLVEHGLNGSTFEKLKSKHPSKIHTHKLDSRPKNTADFLALVNKLRRKNQSNIGFGLSLISGNPSEIQMVYQGSQIHDQTTRSYGGPPENAQVWATNIGFDYLRRHLKKNLVNNKLEKHETS